MDVHHLSPRSRSLVSPAQVVALGLVVASIAWATWLVRDRPRHEEVELLSGSVLPSSELAIMEAAFDRAQLTDYRTEGGRVWVPRARQSAYMRALVDAEALPREFGGSLRRALESNSPWQSRAVQSEILRVATQDELALVICSMPGIERAAVLYDVDDDPTAGGLRGARVKTASVSVRTQPDADLDRARVEAIRVLVAASIAGLAPDRVAVTDLRSGRVHAGPLEDAPAVAAVDPTLARAIAHERHLADKIRQALAFVKGATVDVAIEFGPPAPPAPAAPEPEEFAAAPPQPNAAANAPAEIAVSPPPAKPIAAPAPVAAAVADVPVKVQVAIAVPETSLAAVASRAGGDDRAAAERHELDRLRQHVLGLLPPTPDPADRRVVITSFATPAARREGPAAPPPAAVSAAVADASAATAPATAADEPEIVASLRQLLRALGIPVDDAATIPKQTWIAATCVCVGLLAAWMWWAGSRRRDFPAQASGREPTTIDWSRPRDADRGHEPLDRVAA
jgi:type III secretory pathway lipoprotein EscJ